MLTPSIRNQWAIGVVLMLLLVSTRSHHFATLNQLPGASWAVFFLVGVYLRSLWVFPGMFAAVWLLDFSAVTWGGVGGYCFTPAYAFLLPAYGALWGAGRWYASRHQDTWKTLSVLLPSVVLSAVVCELFSSGSFYLLSERFVALSWGEFFSREMQYFPAYLQAMVFYVVLAVVVHGVLSTVTRGQKTTLTAS